MRPSERDGTNAYASNQSQIGEIRENEVWAMKDDDTVPWYEQVAGGLSKGVRELKAAVGISGGTIERREDEGGNRYGSDMVDDRNPNTSSVRGESYGGTRDTWERRVRKSREPSIPSSVRHKNGTKSDVQSEMSESTDGSTDQSSDRYTSVSEEVSREPSRGRSAVHSRGQARSQSRGRSKSKTRSTGLGPRTRTTSRGRSLNRKKSSAVSRASSQNKKQYKGKRSGRSASRKRNGRSSSRSRREPSERKRSKSASRRNRSRSISRRERERVNLSRGRSQSKRIQDQSKKSARHDEKKERDPPSRGKKVSDGQQNHGRRKRTIKNGPRSLKTKTRETASESQGSSNQMKTKKSWWPLKSSKKAVRKKSGQRANAPSKPGQKKIERFIATTEPQKPSKHPALAKKSKQRSRDVEQYKMPYSQFEEGAPEIDALGVDQPILQIAGTASDLEQGVEMVPFLSPDGTGGLLIVNAGESTASHIQTAASFASPPQGIIDDYNDDGGVMGPESNTKPPVSKSNILKLMRSRSKSRTRSTPKDIVEEVKAEVQGVDEEPIVDVVPADKYQSDPSLNQGYSMFKVHSAKTVKTSDGGAGIIFSNSEHSDLSSLTKRTFD